LYYGNGGKYYRLKEDDNDEEDDDDDAEKFVEVEVDKGREAEPVNLLEEAGSKEAAAATTLAKKVGGAGKIAVKLGGGGKKRKDKAGKEEKGGEVDKKSKSNISKWEKITEESSSCPPATQTQLAIDPNLIICVLCQRKFPTQAKLDKHCRKSDLHKENLRKQAEEEQQQGQQQYTDRNKKRKIMNGEEGGPKKTGTKKKKSRDYDESEDRDGDSSRSKSNPFDPKTSIGSKLLGKMGGGGGSVKGNEQHERIREHWSVTERKAGN